MGVHGPEAGPRPAALGWGWLLSHRLLGFAAVQALVAAAYVAAAESGWEASVAWWPVVAVIVNLFTIALLRILLASEGHSYRDLLRLRKESIRSDLGVVLLLIVAAGLLAVAPNLALASWLFGDSAAPLETFIQPLPLWAAGGAVVLFPVTIALAELPFYFGYLRPRLERMGSPGWLAVALTAAFLALQHATLPLVFDWRFIAWRTLSFLPLAVVFGIALRRRPRLLPYLAVLHGLADLQVAGMVLAASV